MSAADDPEIQEVFSQQDALWGDVSSRVSPDAPAKWEKGIAETLKYLREEAGWSQQFTVERLAKVWGIEMHQTTLAKLEAGNRPVRLSELFALATIYGVNVATVLALQESESRFDPEADLNEKMASYEERFASAKEITTKMIDYGIQELAGIRAQADAMAQLISRRAAIHARAETRDE